MTRLVVTIAMATDGCGLPDGVTQRLLRRFHRLDDARRTAVSQLQLLNGLEAELEAATDRSQEAAADRDGVMCGDNDEPLLAPECEFRQRMSPITRKLSLLRVPGASGKVELPRRSLASISKPVLPPRRSPRISNLMSTTPRESSRLTPGLSTKKTPSERRQNKTMRWRMAIGAPCREIHHTLADNHQNE